MSKRISENDILIPALYIINKYGEASTRLIREELVKMFNPQGEDAEILKGRTDTKFTQIIRNLTGSHYETNDFGKYTNKNALGFSLNDDGIIFLNSHISECDYIYNNNFEYEENIDVVKKIKKSVFKGKKLTTFSEDDTVVEGKSVETVYKSKKRSAMLRETAIEHYRDKDGHIKCCVCGFDFWETYGELGHHFIQIHHEHPICEYEDEGTVQSLIDAVKNVKPVCANCHCMLHRKRKKCLSIDELKKHIK